MLWNELDYTTQSKVINKLYKLLGQENNAQEKQYLLAAIYELEMWSNDPVSLTIEEVELSDEEYIAIAQENYLESPSNSFLSMIFGKKIN